MAAAAKEMNNNKEWPHLNKKRKDGEANKEGRPKALEIDYLTEKEKK